MAMVVIHFYIRVLQPENGRIAVVSLTDLDVDFHK